MIRGDMGSIAIETAIGEATGRVHLGPDTVVQEPCVLGKLPRDPSGPEAATRIGSGGTVRPFTTIYADVVIGDRFQCGQGASIREDNVLGDDVSIGTNAVLEYGNRIGNGVRVHTGCFLELTTLEDDVWVGPNVVFTDDPHPPCPDYRECRGGPIVRMGARIGANSTILPGVIIGAGALVGAGSVVTKDVAPGVIVAGNPARWLGDVSDMVCQAGSRPDITDRRSAR
jgi:acetyltransferase-like isoleucine patch superfamily enzyme